MRNRYGVSLVKIKQYDKAIEQFDMVLAENPHELSALNNLYQAGVESGQIDKTLGIILNLQAKDPNNFVFYQETGLLYGIKGDINTATEQLEKACKLSKSGSRADGVSFAGVRHQKGFQKRHRYGTKSDFGSPEGRQRRYCYTVKNQFGIVSAGNERKLRKWNCFRLLR